MPSGFSDQFEHYFPPGDAVTEAALTSGLVVFDTNVLLALYRFAPGARQELLSVMRRIAERTWIPHQVALEFHKNRLSVMADRDAAYVTVIETLAAQQATTNSEAIAQIRALANRVALSDIERDGLIAEISTSLDGVKRRVEGLRTRHADGEDSKHDRILTELQSIFDGKVGSAFSPDEFRAAETEAKRRIGERIPPGYKDAKKPEPFGDYFIWNQVLQEVKRRQASMLVFVTGDGKEDWYEIIKGRTIGARPTLVEEARSVAGAQLVMLSTQSFLFHAREYLDANVSAETLRQVKNAERVAVVDRHRDEVTELRREVAQIEAALDDLDRLTNAQADNVRRLKEEAGDLSLSAYDRAKRRDSLHDARLRLEDLMTKRLAMERERNAGVEILRDLNIDLMRQQSE